MAGNGFAWSRGLAQRDHPGRLGTGPGRGSPQQGATRGSLPPGAVLVVGQHRGRGGAGPPWLLPPDKWCPLSLPHPSGVGVGAGIRGADSFVPGWKKSGGDVLPAPSPCLRTRWVTLSRGDAGAAGVPSPAFPGGADPLLHPFGSSSVAGQRRPPHLQHLADSAGAMPPAVPVTGWAGAGGPRRAGAGAAWGPTFLLCLGFESAAPVLPGRARAPGLALLSPARRSLPGASVPVAVGWGQPGLSPSAPVAGLAVLRTGQLVTPVPCDKVWGLRQLPGCPGPPGSLPVRGGRASSAGTTRPCLLRTIVLAVPKDFPAERLAFPEPPGHAWSACHPPGLQILCPAAAWGSPASSLLGGCLSWGGPGGCRGPFYPSASL